jgi:hypothetical protein
MVLVTKDSRQQTADSRQQTADSSYPSLADLDVVGSCQAKVDEGLGVEE